MIAIGLKNLLKDKTKFIATVTGVALSTLMVLALIGVYFGITSASRSIPLSAGADYWVVQRGMQNLFNSTSILPAHQERQLHNLPGVNKVVPIISDTTGVASGKQTITADVVGFDTTSGIGRSGTIYSGTAHIAQGQTIIDRVIAHQLKLSLGSKLTIGDKTFTVAGITTGTNLLEFQYIYIPFNDAVAAFSRPDVVSYYFIKSTEPKSNLQSQVQRILPSADVKTANDIANGTVNVSKTDFAPIIGLLVMIGLAVATVVIGLTIYMSTMEHAGEYGILKAVGVSSSKLRQIVLQQTLVSSVTGFAVGLVLYFLVRALAFYAMPEVDLNVAPQYYAYFFVLMMFAGVVASLLPVRKINRIDPAEAFNR